MFGRKALVRKLLYRRALLSNEIHTDSTHHFRLHWFAVVRIAFRELETGTEADGSWLGSSVRTDLRPSHSINNNYNKFKYYK